MTFFSQYSKYPQTATAMMTENCGKMKMQNTVTVQNVMSVEETAIFMSWRKKV